MKTLKITVENDQFARLLIQLLKEFKFVKKAEYTDEKVKTTTYNSVKKILDKKASKKLFKEITDPVEWQKKLRDEWEQAA